MNLFGRTPSWEDEVAHFEDEVLGLLTTVWKSDTVGFYDRYLRDDFKAWAGLNSIDYPLHRPLDESLRRLSARWPTDKLGSLAAAAFTNLPKWRSKSELNYSDLAAASYLLAACIVHFRPSDALPRINQRIIELLEQGVYLSESHPTLEECIDLMAALPASVDNASLAEGILLGKLDREIRDPSRREDQNARTMAYQSHGFALGRGFPVLLHRVFDSGRLSYPFFTDSVRCIPSGLSFCSRGVSASPGHQSSLHTRFGAAFADTVLDYCSRLAWEISQNLSQENYTQLKAIDCLRGSRYLVEAARHVQSRKLRKLRDDVYSMREDIDSAMVHLCQAEEIEPVTHEERAQLREQLSSFGSSALKVLVPVTPKGRRILCEALGWECALPLINLITPHASLDRDKRMSETGDYVSRTAAGGFDLSATELKVKVAQAGEPVTREVLSLFRQARVGVENVVTLIEAVMGWNRDWVMDHLTKTNYELPLRAYALLPIERGEGEVIERYIFFKKFAKEARKFSAEAQFGRLATVQQCLTDLARGAGYPNVTRLEWAMEAKLAEEVPASGLTWTVADYVVKVSLIGAEPEVTCWRGEKQIKSVPAAVKKDASYGEVKDAVEQVRDQARRFRDTFEEMMTLGEVLSAEDLAGLARLPVACDYLRRLVLQTENREFGLFDPEQSALTSLKEEPIPLSGAVTIAHPYHLFHVGHLADWQRAIVRRRVIQPFKQVFRELYILTPAEEETRTFSNRFAGHVLEPRVVGRLLQSRHWIAAGDEYPQPTKVFGQVGLVAVFQFPDVGRHLTETDMITSDRVFFQPYPLPPYPWTDGVPVVPLTEVSPLIFSEVMRDADLFVSVAQREGEGSLSDEAYERRGELVTALLEDLRLPGVTIDGHFAHVQGKLANYRVHLGSAAIHIEPGHYLCIVPDRWGQTHEKLFLPFADATDMKTSEVLSKVLLLIHDNKIKDESILSQIHGRRP